MTAGQRSVRVRIRHRVIWAMVAAVAACVTPVFAQAPGGIPGVLAPGVAPQLVQEGFTFTEGPVGTADGGLYFSDIRVNKTHYLDPGGKIGVVRENTNGANGLALTKDGELLFAEGDSRKITKRGRDGAITTLTIAKGLAEMGLKRVHLIVRTNNPRAIRLYARVVGH